MLLNELYWLAGIGFGKRENSPKIHLRTYQSKISLTRTARRSARFDTDRKSIRPRPLPVRRFEIFDFDLDFRHNPRNWDNTTRLASRGLWGGPEV